MHDRKQRKSNRLLARFSQIMTGWHFASLAIFGLIFFELLMILLLSIPPSESEIGIFARDFRTWCFRYDPSTGQMNWIYVAAVLTEPLILVGIIAWIWKRPLLQAYQERPRQLLKSAGIAFIGVALLGTALIAMSDGFADSDRAYPFPAERLRTAIATTDFELLDHREEPVRLHELRGKVVLITAVYARCGLSCPIILTQLRRTTDSLDPGLLEDLVVLGITLDPEHDGPEELSFLADRHGVSPPLFRLLYGEPDQVNAILDDFSFARIAVEERGEIDHADLFVLIDRRGAIAFRLNLGPRTQDWLKTALEVLLLEEAPSPEELATILNEGEDL